MQGLLRPFDLPTVLWPAGYLLSLWAADPEQRALWATTGRQATAARPSVLDLGTGTGAAAVAAAIGGGGEGEVRCGRGSILRCPWPLPQLPLLLLPLLTAAAAAHSQCCCCSQPMLLLLTAAAAAHGCCRCFPFVSIRRCLLSAPLTLATLATIHCRKDRPKPAR